VLPDARATDAPREAGDLFGAEGAAP
jgi:hypothetical protein